jgi:prepilin-type N-terminal cleavage/methylation domain-containing protein
MSFTRSTNHRSSQGFTLLEVLVVIGIICILAAVLTQTGLVTDKGGRRNSTQSRISGLTTALEAYRVQFDSYPPNPANGFEDDGTLYRYLCGEAGRGVIADPGGRAVVLPALLTLARKRTALITVDPFCRCVGAPLHYSTANST